MENFTLVTKTQQDLFVKLLFSELAANVDIKLSLNRNYTVWGEWRTWMLNNRTGIAIIPPTKRQFSFLTCFFSPGRHALSC